MPLLPKPYPDEVIGSVIERGCFQAGIPMKKMIKSLLGQTRSTCSFLMGSKLPSLSRYLGMDADELLSQHTMYPYAAAFMAPSEQTRIRRKVLSLGEDECIGSITRNVSHGVRRRRICETCFAQDLLEHGESYWRRAHLLPGVWTCAQHRRPLLESNVQVKDNVHMRSVILIDDTYFARLPTQAPPDVAKAVQDVSLAALGSEIDSRDDWPQVYREMAQNAGYAMTGGGIATTRIATDIAQYFGTELLESAGCGMGASSRSWPALMVRDGIPQNNAPAKHVFYQVYCVQGGHPQSDFGYCSPGVRPADTGSIDETASLQIESLLKAHAASERRFTVRELLEEIGIWQSFRHDREKYPLVQAQVVKFRISDQSSRQLGLRPYWRHRLRSRLRPVRPNEDT